MHQTPAEIRKCLSFVNFTDSSFSCLLVTLVSYGFEPEMTMLWFLCLVEIPAEEV